MTKRWLRGMAWVLLCLALGVQDVRADPAGERIRFGAPGPYLGLGGNFFVGEDSGGNGELLVGYRAAKHFAVDLDLQYGSHELLRFAVQPKLFLLGDTRVQPFLLTGLGLLTDVGGGSSGTLGLFRPGLGIDVHVDEQVALAVTGYYEFYFNSRNVGFPEAGFVSVLVRFDL